MIWVAFATLCVAVLAALFLLASRSRGAFRALRSENDAMRGRLQVLSEAVERGRAEREKINDRAAGHSTVIRENRTGVQQAKNRTKTHVERTDDRFAKNATIVNDLRRVTRQHGQAIATARIGVQQAKDRIQTVHQQLIESTAQSTDISLPVGDLSDSETIRGQPEVVEALRQLATAATLTASSGRTRRSAFTPVDLSKLLSQRAAPMVTVVVTSFNDGKFLEACLRSVGQQTLREYECIIVDDASTDDSLAIAQAFSSSDDRFSVIAHDANSGPSAARNTGLAAARAPFIAFLDSDDLLLSESLEERLFTLLRHGDPAVAGVFSGVEHRSENTTLDELPSKLDWTPPGKMGFITSKGECPFNLHAPLLRTDLIRRMRGFDEDMREGAEDWDLWLRMMRNGWVFEPCHSTLGIYRQKHRSMVRALPAAHLAASEQLLASVHLPADPSSRASGAPFFFDQALPSYEAALVLAERTFQYLALASITEDDAQLTQAKSAIQADLAPLFSKHIDASGRINAGLRRGLGLSAEQFAAVRPEVTIVRDNLLDHVDTLYDAHNQQRTPTFPKPSLTPSPAPLQLFYWQAADGVPGSGNFGDELSPLLVELASGRRVERAPLESCQLVSLGSVLDLAVEADHSSPAIWGSGFIRDGLTTGADLQIHAVRGKLSNDRCGSIGAIGDPALLARHLGVEPSGSYRVGLVPHYVDRHLPLCQSFASETDGALLIDPLQPPLDVLSQIASCDVVFSSSLHGLICADSLGIPNAWVELSHGVVGAGYKFADYYSCFDLSPTAIRPVTGIDIEKHTEALKAAYSRPGLERLADTLVSAFPNHL